MFRIVIKADYKPIMSKITSREIRLASRPKGVPTADNFTPAQTELRPLLDQQVLVRNLFMSVDPYMRGRMNAGKSYVPPFELGKPLEGKRTQIWPIERQSLQRQWDPEKSVRTLV